MRRLLIITAFIAACTPLSEAERDDREYNWQEHVTAWRIFEAACHAQGGHIFTVRVAPHATREFIPRMHDWRHWYDEDGKLHWNSASVFCRKR